METASELCFGQTVDIVLNIESDDKPRSATPCLARQKNTLNAALRVFFLWFPSHDARF